MPEQVVVINKEGEMVFINKGWQNFGEENDCSCGAWEKENYLPVKKQQTMVTK
ncbi:hypothetical protein P20480_2289 [Pseudoalteromonas sp. BSi20480]|nr:hypothetical protein P20480_2289 [Pseudoalteromonas sp. BSi20480]